MADLPRAENGDYAGDVTPSDAWERLASEPSTVLIDVRTDAEYGYVGRPDLTSIGKDVSLVSWCLFPDNEINSNFVAEVTAMGIGADSAVLCLCRSGVRSRHAAAAMTAAGYLNCFNILEGFEGDKDPDGHRGTVGGWKVAGLPWVQG